MLKCSKAEADNQTTMPLAKHSPFSSPVFWCILVAGFLLVPLFAALDLHGVGPRLHFGMSYGISGAGLNIIGIGFLLSVLAPWSCRGLVRGRVGLSVAIGFVWLVGMDVFLNYHAARYSRREHAQEIEAAYNERLLPAMAFIRSFYDREHRLPTEAEIESTGWQTGWDEAIDPVIHYRPERPQWYNSWGVPGKDFVVETRVADWTLRCLSWDNKRIESTFLDL